LSPAKAEALAVQYQRNLDLYGQIAIPKEGELSAREMIEKKGKDGGSKDEQKRLKAEAKSKAAAKKAEEKARAQQEKERMKEEKRAAKAAAEREKEASSAAAIIAPMATPSDANSDKSTYSEARDDESSADTDHYSDGGSGGVALVEVENPSETSKGFKSGGIKIIPASGAVIALAGGTLLVKTMRERSAAEEAERQRRFKLLMGADEKEVSDSVDGKSASGPSSDIMFEYESETEKDDAPAPILADPGPRKKRRGLKSVFGKKNNARETDIAKLVSDEANAPEFAKTLAKLLTFGAPGRFPEVAALPGNAPLEDFDLEKASVALVEAQEEAGITKEESAEIFANVVNCMLIDIVDLASSSLKEKENKATLDALGIVIEFMDLAAQLYLSIAEGITIVPVTYGGDIGKSKLEQMYSAYATSGMSNVANLDEKFEDRLNLLRDVFQISEAKAEGLMTKAMQKNLMNMMKDPEKMEEMMKNMNFDEGMPGIPGMDEEEPDSEQVKEMLVALKALKDSGSLPKSELENVKKQFKEAYGTNLEELMQQADENKGALADADKEMLELMKSILS
jgi:hypothetical protein